MLTITAHSESLARVLKAELQIRISQVDARKELVQAHESLLFSP